MLKSAFKGRHDTTSFIKKEHASEHEIDKVVQSFSLNLCFSTWKVKQIFDQSIIMKNNVNHFHGIIRIQTEKL